jgi:hypothetical protein
MTKRRLGELLQAEGLVTEDQVRAGLEEQRKSSLFLGEALVKLGFVSEEAIAHTIVQQFSLPFMSANQVSISIDVLTIFPERMYYEYQFIAVDKLAKVLIIVGAGLMNHDVLDELERLSGCKVCQFVSTWKDIKSALDKHAKDLRKEQQSELSSLGTMLLDITPEPMPVPVIPAQPVAGKPAVPIAAAATARPAAATTSPAAVKPSSPVTNAPRPAAATGLIRSGPATQSIQKSALSGGSQRISALATPKAGASNSGLPKVPAPASNSGLPKVPAPASTPPAAAPAPEGQQTGNPPPAKGNTGLLGLFKKS